MQYPQSRPGPIHLVARDPEELSQLQPEKRREYRQLEAGVFQGALTLVPLDGVHLLREHVGPRTRVVSAPPPHTLPIGFLLEHREPIRFCGDHLGVREIAHGTKQGVWDATLTGGLTFGALNFETDVLEKGFEGLTGQPFDRRWLNGGTRSLGPALVDLRTWLCQTLDDVASDPAILRHDHVRRRLADEALSLLVRALTSPQCEPEVSTAPRRRAAVRLVEDYVRHLEPTNPPSMELLCKLTGVSERTLEYAFREHLGVTPRKFLTVHRLNGARQDLRRASPDTDSVTRIAMAWGFTELGRFAGAYRAFFGELPSRTLRGGAA